MKKKILLLSDDFRMTSGVATMSREIIMGTVHKYDWIQLGAAINHPEVNKFFDLSEDVANKTGVKDAYVRLIPYNSYGDIEIIRAIMKEEKPDAILHFTDPHYWQWLYDNEHEVRQQIPIFFYHIWDDLPDPLYNRNYYESCDWIGCISKQTYGIVKRVGKMNDKITYEQLKNWQISYVPHGINQEIFKPIENISENTRSQILGNKEYDFILFFNNRNIRRKQPSDVIYCFRMFCDLLPREKAEKCLLLMHTTPVDENGTDLIAVIEALCPDFDVKILNYKVEQETLNEFYNLVDCTINISNNEGFGLSTAESIMAGTPIIVNVTGGLQDQCGFNVDGEEFSADDYVKIGSLHDAKKYSKTEHGEWAFPVFSAARNLNGSPLTPYIFDDRVNNYDVVDKIMEVYSLGRKERKKLGKKGREWAIKNLSAKVMCETMMNGIDVAFENYKHKKRYNLYKIK